VSERTSASSRLESLSDGAFAVAIGLLVVSVADPRTFGDLTCVIRGAPGIAGAFAVILWLWSEHRRFFRRYALDDVPTVFLNGVLLFLVLFYVYPLKFVAAYVLGVLFRLDPDSRVSLGSASEGAALLQIYGVGFVALFATFVLLSRRAWRLRKALGLDALARFDTRASLRSSALCMAVGGFSILFTLVPANWATAVAGFSYALLGPVMGFHGYYTGVARAKLEASLVLERPPT
jgi:uncharacterized membrane protein